MHIYTIDLFATAKFEFETISSMALCLCRPFPMFDAFAPFRLKNCFQLLPDPELCDLHPDGLFRWYCSSIAGQPNVPHGCKTHGSPPPGRDQDSIVEWFSNKRLRDSGLENLGGVMRVQWCKKGDPILDFLNLHAAPKAMIYVLK